MSRNVGIFGRGEAGGWPVGIALRRPEREDVVPVLEGLLVLPHEDRADTVAAEATVSPRARNEPSPPETPRLLIHRMSFAFPERAELNESTANSEDRAVAWASSSPSPPRGAYGRGPLTASAWARSRSSSSKAGFFVGFEGRVDSYTVTNGKPLATLEHSRFWRVAVYASSRCPTRLHRGARRSRFRAERPRRRPDQAGRAPPKIRPRPASCRVQCSSPAI